MSSSLDVLALLRQEITALTQSIEHISNICSHLEKLEEHKYKITEIGLPIIEKAVHENKVRKDGYLELSKSILDQYAKKGQISQKQMRCLSVFCKKSFANNKLDFPWTNEELFSIDVVHELFTAYKEIINES